VAEIFRLPDIGEGLTDAEIVEWSVAVGDSIAEGAQLCEVETAKAVVELTSPWGGVVLHRGGEAGDTIAVGGVLVVIGRTGETWTPDEGYGPVEEPATAAAPELAPAGTAIRAMPVVRRLAEDLGVDLATIIATGPGGKITRDDVIRAADEPDTVADGMQDERVPLSRLRRTIAEHMSRSWLEIPHVTTFDDVDVSSLLTRRTSLAAAGSPTSIDALLIRAVLPALAAHPEFNATLDGEDLILHRNYHIAIAIDTPAGLVVPVVRAADTLDPAGLATAINDLSERARQRTLQPEELTGGTFTVSNIGALGGGHGTPIIPFGTTAIISFGRAVERPAVVDGEILIAPILPISLSYDHRVIDGGLGRRFIDRVIADITEGN